MHLTGSIFEVTPVTNHSRIEHVSELALIGMDAKVKQFCWDCRVGHKVTVEGPEQARGGEVGQPI
jgi:UDP-N-acetylglucosamine enolpyruvyl transferase